MLNKALTLLLISCLSASFAPSTHAAEEKGKKEKELKRVLQLPLIIIPVIDEGHIRRYFGIHMRIELTDPKVSLDTQEKIPKLVDRVFTNFYRLFSILNHTNTFLTPKQMRDQIDEICVAVLGEGIVQQVMLDNFTMHNVEEKKA